MDIQGPLVTIDSGPAGPTNDTTPTFTFSADEPVTFHCKFDGEAFGDCSGPGDSHTTATLAPGPHTFSVRGTDAVGFTATDEQAFTIDTTPPQTQIDSGPGAVTNDPILIFRFSSNEAIGSQSCWMDSDLPGACSHFGRHEVATPADGAHTFNVALTDVAGNTDPTPATYNFTVDTDPPTVSIDSGPSGPTSDSTPTFTFSGDEPIPLWQCRVDPAPFGSCGPVNGTHTTAELADGPHTFRVLGTDPAGNSHQVARSFTVDTDPPETSIDAGPSGPTSDETPEWNFSSNEAGATFECRLLPAAFAACTSPHETAVLADGAYTIEVRAKDAAGNVDASPATRSVTVDTVDPTSSIAFPDHGEAYQSAAYNEGCDDDTPDICGGAADQRSGVGAVQVSLQRASDDNFWDGASWGGTEVLLSPAGLNPWTLEFTPGEDTYTVSSRATDIAGNVESPASVTFTIDDTAPQTAIDSGPSGATNDSTPTFTFSSESGATFQCRLTGPDFIPCASPFTPSAALAA
ncbi:MAG: hypothetical protein WEA81_05390, partial [Dehalococcoidia bacterium]